MCDVDEAWFLSLSSRGGRRGSGRGGPLQLGQTDFARRLSQEHTGEELDPSRASSPRPSPPSDGGEGEVGGSVRMHPRLLITDYPLVNYHLSAYVLP